MYTRAKSEMTYDVQTIRRQLSNTILYRIILYYTILYYTILNFIYTHIYYTILYYTILYYTILCYFFIRLLTYLLTYLPIMSQGVGFQNGFIVHQYVPLVLILRHTRYIRDIQSKIFINFQQSVVDYTAEL